MSRKIGSPDELRELRDRARREVDLRDGERQVRITVHMGTCGIAAGAREVMAALMDELSASEANWVTLAQSGCLGLCDQEPMLTLRDAAGCEFVYARLDPDCVRRIVRRHVMDGTPVADLLAYPAGRGERGQP